jgi:hypothetical protein
MTLESATPLKPELDPRQLSSAPPTPTPRPLGMPVGLISVGLKTVRRGPALERVRGPIVFESAPLGREIGRGGAIGGGIGGSSCLIHAIWHS